MEVPLQPPSAIRPHAAPPPTEVNIKKLSCITQVAFVRESPTTTNRKLHVHPTHPITKGRDIDPTLATPQHLPETPARGPPSEYRTPPPRAVATFTPATMSLERLDLEHIPPAYQVYTAYFRDVANTEFLHKQLLSRNTEFQYAFIDASSVISRLHILSAVYSAVNVLIDGTLRTPNVHSEMVVSLNINNNVRSQPLPTSPRPVLTSLDRGCLPKMGHIPRQNKRPCRRQGCPPTTNYTRRSPRANTNAITTGHLGAPDATRQGDPSAADRRRACESHRLAEGAQVLPAEWRDGVGPGDRRAGEAEAEREVGDYGHGVAGVMKRWIDGMVHLKFPRHGMACGVGKAGSQMETGAELQRQNRPSGCGKGFNAGRVGCPRTPRDVWEAEDSLQSK